MRIPFDSVVQLLNRRTKVVLRDDVGDPTSPLYKVPVRDPRVPEPFIEPTFASVGRAISDEQSGLNQVLLIRAAAAVGKSTLALALADRCSGLLWNLGLVRVGNGTLDGVMTRAYGYEAPSDISRALRVGDLTIVIDALDEALMRSSHNVAVESLAADIRAILGPAVPTGDRTPRPAVGFAIVVLGRPSSIELLELALGEAGVGASVLDVDYFDVQSSVRLVVEYRSRTLLAQSRSGVDSRPVSREHLEASIYQILQRLQDEIAGGFGTEPLRTCSNFLIGSGEFLGYAPVLMAIAESLAVDARDFDDVVAEMLDGESLSMWSIMMLICERILLREQHKILEGLRTNLEGQGEYLPEGVLREFCTPNVQIRLLLEGIVDLEDVVISSQVPISDSQKSVIRDTVDSFIGDHPFLKEGQFSNVHLHRDDCFKHAVFRDFCYARVCRGIVRLTNGHELSLLRHSKSLDNPMLARFCLASSSRNGEVPDSAVDAEFVPVFLSSLQADRSQLISSLTIREREIRPTNGLVRSEGEHVLDLVLNESEARSIGTPAADDVSGCLRIPGDSPLIIWDRLAGILVDVPSVDVVLKSRLPMPDESDQFILFDGSALSCGNLSIESTSILLVPPAMASQEGGGVVEPIGCTIQVHGKIASSLARVHDESGELALYCPQVPGYPLQRLHRGGPLAYPSKELEGPARLLRQLVTNFGRAPANRGRGLVVYANAVDNALSSGRIDRGFFNFGTEIGLIVREGDLYRLRFNELGISLNLARLGDYRNSPELHQLLERFSRTASE